MTVEQKIQAILIANTALTALVPASRIRVPGDWQSLDIPYIVHSPSGIAAFRTHDGLPAMTEFDVYRVTAFASTYSSGAPISDAVIAALDGVHNGVSAFLQSFRHVTENETGIGHFIVEFQVFEAPQWWFDKTYFDSQFFATAQGG